MSAFWALQHQETTQSLNQGANRGIPTEENKNDDLEGASPQSLKPPNLAKYDFNPKRVAELLKEYGAMLPSKDVYCTPDPKVISFLK